MPRRLASSWPATVSTVLSFGLSAQYLSRRLLGETEWTKNGRYTGRTELSITPKGVEQVASTGIQLVGPGKLIDPRHVGRIWVSPRKRAQETFQCLFNSSDVTLDDSRVTLTEDITEWDYGDYEGLLINEIRARRNKKGLDQEREWNIWRDGCEGGESAGQVTKRLDRLISEIREYQRPNMNGEKPADVVLVRPSQFLRFMLH